MFAHCLCTRSGWRAVVATPPSEPNDVTPTCYPCTRASKHTIALMDPIEQPTINIQHHRSVRIFLRERRVHGFRCSPLVKDKRETAHQHEMHFTRTIGATAPARSSNADERHNSEYDAGDEQNTSSEYNDGVSTPTYLTFVLPHMQACRES